MALRPTETIALIFILLAFLKIFVVLVNRNKWYEKVVKPIYSGSNSWTILFLLLAILVFYYLLQELSIVHIFAVMAFISLVMGIGFMQHSKEILEFSKKIYNKKLTMWRWVYLLVWSLLLLWALVEIL